MLRRLAVGTLFAVLATNAHSATNRPEGYVTICKLGQTCSVGSNVNVAFGASGYFGVFRTDSSASTARLTNSRVRSAGKVCIGPWASCTQSGNVSY